MKVSEKVDVYSYGVVLLELLTRMDPLDPALPEGMDLVTWVIAKITESQTMEEILDTQLRSSGYNYILKEMLLTLRIALFCVSRNPSERPTMREVVAMLLQARSTTGKDLDEKETLVEENIEEKTQST